MIETYTPAERTRSVHISKLVLAYIIGFVVLFTLIAAPILFG